MKKSWMLLILLIIISAVSLFVGVIDISINDIFTSKELLEVFLLSRVPRLLALLCCGIGMSVSGLIMQQLCRNRFMSPTTGSTINGAQLGVLIALILFPSSSVIFKAILAFIFALISTVVFVLFTQRIKFKDVVMVPLIGIMMGNVIKAFTSFLAYNFDLTQSINAYFTGHFSAVIRGKYELVYLVLPLIIIAYIYANHFNIVGMGKNFATNLGLKYEQILFLGLGICSLITASIVVVVGSVSYIGLIIPNIVTIYKGERLKGTLLDTALLGALYVLVCDMLARIIIFPYELPIELVSGVIGSIIFIVLLIRRLSGKGVKYA